MLLGAPDAARWLRPGTAFAQAPEHWIYPAQTLLCGALLAVFWRQYPLRRPARVVFTIAIALLIFVLWIAPQVFFHAAARREGFDPTFFEKNRPLFFAVLAMRFARLVIVVPLIEEIFWRGFLLRFFIAEDFENVRLGAYSHFSFAAVTLGFMLEHQRADWPAALLAGALFNAIAYHTKNLTSCVLAHAVTNALLGVYIVQTRQWGFW